ncbi:protein DGCR14-like [Mizuhopecten yessoensis]|uniref:Protein DGCR14 n=1 Tax=Mizuhopecten yessoensis TaxID=6573 RepID=A0A210PVA4_MIZYE|nr:protein DGCR14-like [Mizuhopecten yessoensis]OWF40395.1 Protein DGCR14 [Mizuhopecten yessoensis]
MALQKADDLTVATTGSQRQENQKNTVKVLDEETYTKNLENIIERDFFPDMPKLQSHTEYFTALEKNDLVKLREIQMRRNTNRPNTGSSTGYTTPATFETPEPESRQKSPKQREPETESKTTKEKDFANLDKFLSKNTSEDNASFAEILEETQKQQREKHAWLYENERDRTTEEDERLALPSIEQQAIEAPPQAGADSWKYKARNSLMYVPDGVKLSKTEEMELKKGKSREIIHENTRFQISPWNQIKSTEQIKMAASLKALACYGKIGHDGKEVMPLESPKVNGYGFVGTPSPAPGVDESPFMTWGEIDGTPFRIEGSDTPFTGIGGPAFKIPEMPKRDRLALDLSEKASKAHRDKKEKALKSVQARLSSPSPKFGRSTTERLQSMSPAAQRLATAQLGVRTQSDKALQASYTPSPTHRLAGGKTPTLTPKLTPKSASSTPTGERTPGSKREGSDIASLTDNLLQLPKRKKASDFF